MIFKCGLCEKTKIGKHSKLVYRALSDDGLPEDYEMKICKQCSKYVSAGAVDGRPERD